MATSKTFFNTIWRNKYTFFGVYFLAFLLTYLVLVAVDFVPEPPAESVATETASVETESDEIPALETIDEPVAVAAEPVLPTEIYIERLDKRVSVLNPTTRSVADLDKALLSGAVRHPDSAHLAQTGNVFVLGHSSYLPNVFNPNYQAFNGIQELKWGDIIEVVAEGQIYVYRVEKVYEARAQELVVPIAVEEKMLTLATCDSFGSIDDRFIVEAKQVEVREA